MEATKFLLLFITLNIFSSCIEAADSFGFSIDLIHRDSMFSPYFNPSNTRYDNLRNSIRHSMARSTHLFTPNYLASSSETIQSPLTAVPAEYLMKISVGTPPLDLLAVADTGSDLVWTQCEPCTNCYQQDAPLFNPKHSSTYKNQPCQSNACQSLPSTSCDGNKCTYQVSYGDKSFSTGDLSSESFTFESTSGTPVVIPNIAFGCGHSNGGKFEKYTNGIVGLGNGQLSIVNQLSDTINGKFSYCLVPVGANMTSKVSFGSNAVVSGPGVQTTPFYTREDTDTFYYLNLESVSVGNANVKFDTDDYAEKASVGNGNIIIDSGTTITFVPSEFYQQLEDEFKSSLSLTPIETQGSVFSLCYEKEDGYEDKVPTVTFHFTGADVELGVSNTLLEVQEGVICLSMVPATDELGAIFGNLQQMNYLVGYDLVSKTVSFKKSDCTQL
ncbi:aspartic proteinase CDR1-like [Heracleum sosnowskyi]|uniref:Aspartic proteinase CDR1-like n=1 Tax=Heracleum sosnowskyi TaxID=360622 RepID=A0AAD8MG72_9APIA|nr:aspartic proteinase CDR1-like [Heracleum sosnowskyi]